MTTRGTPQDLRVNIDANGALSVTDITQVPPMTQVQFSNARLAVDTTGNLLVSGAGGGGSGNISGTLVAGRVTLSAGTNTITDDAGLVYDTTLDALSVANILAVGPAVDITDPNGFGSIQLTVNRSVTGDPGYAAGMGLQAILTTGDTEANTVFSHYYHDADSVVSHTLSSIVAHDNTQHITLSGGAAIGFITGISNDLRVSGTGTLTQVWNNYAFKNWVGVTVTDYEEYHAEAPVISGGATVGRFVAYGGSDLAGLVATTKHFINYTDKFIVDSAGIVKAAGYKSSDGSSGVSGVSGSATFKDGLATTIVAVPTVKANRTTNQSIADSTVVYVALNAADSFDTDTMHDTVTNNTRITFNTAGVYQLIGEVTIEANAVGSRYLVIDMNGVPTRIATINRLSIGLAGDVLQISTLAKFAVADFVELGIFQTSSVALNASSVSFSAVRVAVG